MKKIIEIIKKIRKKMERCLRRKKQTIKYIDLMGVDTFFLIYEIFVYGDTAVCRIVKYEKMEGEFIEKKTKFRRCPLHYALEVLNEVKIVNKTRDCGFGGFPEF